MNDHSLLIDMPRPHGCPQHLSNVELAIGIRELIFPGLHPDVSSETLHWAEYYCGTDVWFLLGRLGPAHPFPFEQHNYQEVLITWLPKNFVLNQEKFMNLYGDR